MRGRTAYVSHFDCSRHDTGWKHPEHQGRLPAVARAVHRDMLDLFDHLLEVEGIPATAADLAEAHTEEYVRRVADRCRQALAAEEVLSLDGEVAVSGASWDAALAAAGCVLTAARSVEAGEARNAFCAVRPPGHGARADAAGAFGIFNSAAVGALRLLRSGAAGAVWVVEWGSRPGTGTASILAGEARARFVSLHCAESDASASLAGGAVVRRLPARSGLPVVLAALRDALEEVEPDLAPEFILLSLGCDALAGDPLGRLSLTPRDYYDLTVELRSRAERLCGGRLVSVLEEGYDPGEMARAVVQHLRALAGLPPHEG